MSPSTATSWIRRFDDVGMDDVPLVGGKNASLGEMTRTLSADGIAVPEGFATTADAYRLVVAENGLEALITAHIAQLRAGREALAEAGAAIRAGFLAATMPAEVADEIRAGYRELCERTHEPSLAVAVRSSATAEDLPTASFAGQQETFLNVSGEDALLDACRQCHASLFTDRAIAYRERNGFGHLQVGLSIGVQRMVRSDRGASGVMFTLDTESGCPSVVLINAAYGLGENVVKGIVDPDEVWLFKPALADPARTPVLRVRLGEKAVTMVLGTGAHRTVNVATPEALRRRPALTDPECIALGRWAVQIEAHYAARAGHPVPMDIEWAKDGVTGALFIVQARPETVRSREAGAGASVFTLRRTAAVLARGRAVGSAIAAGPVRVLRSPTEPFAAGSVLVTEMTDPDWLPVMRQASAIVTDHGGRTCHAAILSRELGIPAVVGTGHGTETLAGAGDVTVSCAQGDEGRVYAGRLAFDVHEQAPPDATPTRTHVMLNLADPGSAFRHWRLGADGIGLARMEFIIANEVRVHPMALLHPERITDAGVRAQVEALRAGEREPGGFFIETLARGVATLAASQYPRPVIVRMSDFKTNEYANLLGGRDFEPHEENPMIGFRGASRYAHPRYREGFRLECAAMKRAREAIGLDNIILMIPFCRTLGEADAVLAEMAAAGLERGRDGLKVYVMCEIPSNVILATEFARRFDGFSIGSNDLTQLTLGIDRDSELLADAFDERDPAVMTLIRQVIERAHAAGVPVGLCGQAPSDDPSFAEFLVEAGIDSISLNPDSVATVRARVRAMEARDGVGTDARRVVQTRLSPGGPHGSNG
ncbi:MAG: phosphoenolpyruvate synthase [Gemmatimonadetes bacterium]|nr:phosphoenolpyruvate synthase [Gemmatimonadota bacterium]